LAISKFVVVRKNNFFKKISAVISNMEIIAEKKQKKKKFCLFHVLHNLLGVVRGLKLQISVSVTLK
jgi:hypothetical protein